MCMILKSISESIFFFKQKTAYEMRISDWSSDVCSSDLAAKRGVIAAGGLPVEFPTVSLGENFLNPTSMLYRNLMAMDTEEMIAAQPMDAVEIGRASCRERVCQYV